MSANKLVPYDENSEEHNERGEVPLYHIGLTDEPDLPAAPNGDACRHNLHVGAVGANSMSDTQQTDTPLTDAVRKGPGAGSYFAMLEHAEALERRLRRYEEALKEIAEAYANNEPISAQWAAEALTKDAK